MKLASAMTSMTLFLALGFQAHAEVLTCRAQVPKTGCGSGEVELKLNMETHGLDLRIGDIECWGVDLELQGVGEPTDRSYPYFGSQAFQIHTTRDEHYAQLFVDRKLGVALLRLDPEKSRARGVVGSQYNLTCEAPSGFQPESDPTSVYEVCRNGKVYCCDHGRCLPTGRSCER